MKRIILCLFVCVTLGFNTTGFAIDGEGSIAFQALNALNEAANAVGNLPSLVDNATVDSDINSDMGSSGDIGSSGSPEEDAQKDYLNEMKTHIDNAQKVRDKALGYSNLNFRNEVLNEAELHLKRAETVSMPRGGLSNENYKHEQDFRTLITSRRQTLMKDIAEGIKTISAQLSRDIKVLEGSNETQRQDLLQKLEADMKATFIPSFSYSDGLDMSYLESAKQEFSEVRQKVLCQNPKNIMIKATGIHCRPLDLGIRAWNATVGKVVSYSGRTAWNFIPNTVSWGESMVDNLSESLESDHAGKVSYDYLAAGTSTVITWLILKKVWNQHRKSEHLVGKLFNMGKGLLNQNVLLGLVCSLAGATTHLQARKWEKQWHKNRGLHYDPDRCSAWDVTSRAASAAALAGAYSFYQSVDLDDGTAGPSSRGSGCRSWAKQLLQRVANAM